MWKCREIWWILILGLFLTPDRSEGRAVNISNTWTLPQEGFKVFYRFFRDKISWFEADAVCQFHHANLVTVENSFQFDASRDFLKVLDVVEPVWIGLMRAQNSKRFSWSNSKPLPSESGYWAEPLPLMESPLCAVIDPVRDFRWHALRCGGPETASFLCEMNVPNWAEECTLREIPSLTIQYMADSGSVELSKDCGEEGTIHQICKGIQDRERILKELVCKNDKTSEIGQNSITSTGLADTYYKSMQIIRNVSSDNDEDNNISTQPGKTKEEKKEPEQNPVQKLIEQFNVEELMQADQPHPVENVENDKVSKPVKKTVKKAKAFEKKDKSPKKMKELKSKEKPVPLEDMMMGDQPAPAADVSEAEEPLPHIKKSLPQDLRHLETTTEILTTVTSRHEPESTSISVSSEISDDTTSAAIITTPSVETKTGTIGHPMHPHQRRDGAGAAPTEEASIHPMHIKESSDSHFIPPMLLVKSHYTSTKSHLDSIEKGDTVLHHADPSTVKHDSSLDISTVSPQSSIINTESLSTSNTSNAAPSPVTDNFLAEKESKVAEKVSSTTFEPPSTEHQIVEIKIGNSDNPTTFSITTRAIPVPADVGPTTTVGASEHDQNGGGEIASIPQKITRNEFPSTKHLDSHSSEKSNSMEEQPKVKNKFSNEENFQPFKPNRRRILTKPETTTYLKKILG